MVSSTNTRRKLHVSYLVSKFHRFSLFPTKYSFFQDIAVTELTVLILTNALRAPTNASTLTVITGRDLTFAIVLKENELIMDEKTGVYHTFENNHCDIMTHYRTKGYQKSNANDKLCSDLDECANKLHDCSQDATCINTAPSFNCTCNAGNFSITEILI